MICQKIKTAFLEDIIFNSGMSVCLETDEEEGVTCSDDGKEYEYTLQQS